MAYDFLKTHVRKTSSQFLSLRNKLISVAGLVGQDIVNQEGGQLGTVADIVVRWDTNEPYPPLSGIIAKVSRRHVWIKAEKISSFTPTKVELLTAKLDLREFKPRDGEVRLVEEVLDHQLIDVDGVQVVRASDLYIAQLSGHTRLVGVDVSLRSLIRRLGSRRFRTKPTPEQVIDWATIQSFGGQETAQRNLKLSAHRNELRRLRPGELADLLEDLGREERQEILTNLPTAQAADVLEEMEPEEVETILRETAPEESATYLSNMEPDEAADALRDVDTRLREDLLQHMTPESAEKVGAILAYEETTAGGFMNTAIYTASHSETVGELRSKLQKDQVNLKELDAIVLTNTEGEYVYDLSIIDLLLSQPDMVLRTLITLPEPPTVHPTDSVNSVADVLIESRRSSVVVTDEQRLPLGRIFADDVVDALRPNAGRFHFPRLLS